MNNEIRPLFSTSVDGRTVLAVTHIYNSSIYEHIPFNDSSVVHNTPENETNLYIENLKIQTTRAMIPAMAYLILISLTGLVGNFLVLLVYSGKFRQTSTRIFIVAIACFDIVTNVVAIPGEIYDMFHIWDFDEPIACKVRLFFNAFTTMVAAMTLVALAVVRYRKICTPFRKQVSVKYALLITASLITTASVFSIPYAIINGRHSRPTPRAGIYGYECSVDDKYINTIWPFVNGAFFLFLYFSCSIPLVVLYILVGVKACKHTRIHTLPSSSRNDNDVNANDSSSSAETHTKRFENAKLNLHRSIRENSLAESSQISKQLSVHTCQRKDVTEVSSETMLPTNYVSRSDYKNDSRDIFDTKHEHLNDIVLNNDKLNTRRSYKLTSNRSKCTTSSVSTLSTGTIDIIQSAAVNSVDVSDYLAHNSILFEKVQAVATYEPNRNYSQLSDESVINYSHFNESIRNCSQVSKESTTNCLQVNYESTRNCSQINDNGKRDHSQINDSQSALYRVENEKEGENVQNITENERFITGSPTTLSTLDRAPKMSIEVNRQRKIVDLRTVSLASTSSSTGDTGVSSNKNKINDSTLELMNKRSKNNSNILNDSTEIKMNDYDVVNKSGKRDIQTEITYKTKLHVGGKEPDTKVTDVRLGRRRRVVGHTTCMLIFISTVYILSFLPYLVLIFAKSASPQTFESLQGASLAVYNIFLRSYFFNSAANPIIYSLCDVRFRRECLNMFKCT